MRQRVKSVLLSFIAAFLPLAFAAFVNCSEAKVSADVVQPFVVSCSEAAAAAFLDITQTIDNGRSLGQSILVTLIVVGDGQGILLVHSTLRIRASFLYLRIYQDSAALRERRIELCGVVVCIRILYMARRGTLTPPTRGITASPEIHFWRIGIK